MKFSMLLPTFNGGKYLRACISSVLDDPYPDMELVVSDNANTDETQDVLRSFSGDKRLKVVRLQQHVNVIDNWNNVLKASSGDYCLMMGDDDCLLPGYFKRMEEILRKYDNPDCVLYNGITYIPPQSLKGNKESYYKMGSFSFDSDFRKEGLLSTQMLASIVRDMYRFKVRIPLNMLNTLFSRRSAMAYMHGEVFRAPCPDHYALLALLVCAPRWVYVPENLLVIGMSPKSMGSLVYSNRHQDGMNYLGWKFDFKDNLPGPLQLNVMNTWLGLIKKDYPEKLKGVHISRSNYVKKRFYHWCMHYASKEITLHEFMARIRLLTLRDWVCLCSIFFDRECWKRALLMTTFPKKTVPQRMVFGIEPLEGVTGISEFRDRIIDGSIGGKNRWTLKVPA